MIWNYPFPPDVIATSTYQFTGCTLQHMTTGECINELKQIVHVPAGEKYTVLQSTLYATRGIGSEIKCGITSASNPLPHIQWAFNQGGIKTDLYVCEGGAGGRDITLSWLSGASNNTWAEIYYVPYDLTQISMNTSTNTPYISSQVYDQGVLYSYSPLQAQIGYGLWILTFFLFAFLFYKIAKPKK